LSAKNVSVQFMLILIYLAYILHFGQNYTVLKLF